MINTRSKFYYGYEITESNNLLDFDEGSGELTATLTIGKYTFTEFMAEIERALNAASANTYTVSNVTRLDQIIDISVDSGTFSFLAFSGTNVGNDPFSLMGFNAVDTSADTSASSDDDSGSVWVPQFWIQDYVPFANNKKAIDSLVKKSQGGVTEAVIFSTEYIAEMNFRYITDHGLGDGSPVENDPTGVSSALAFMDWVTKRGKVEFMPDRDVPLTYYTCELESTPEDTSFGLSFKLKELYSQGLVGWYETGLLKFRLIE